MTRWTSDLATASDWGWVCLGVAPLAGIGLLLVLVGHADVPGPAPERLLRRFAAGIERLLHVPAWVGALVGTGLWGTMLAGFGFRWDLGWHVAHGRDATLVPPHVLTLIGTALTQLGAVLAICIATVRRDPGAIRWRALRLPPAAVVVGGLSLVATSGIVIDDIWHRVFGKDAQVWSPPHLVMLVSGGLVPFGFLLALRDGGSRLRPAVGWIARVVTFVAATAALSALQAEFASGGARALQIQHPILVAVVAGGVVCAARWTLGLGGGLAVVGLLLAVNAASPPWGLHRPREALFIGAALVAELAFARRPRTGAGLAGRAALVGCGAYLGEHLWYQRGFHPWPDLLLLPGLAVSALVTAAAATVAARLLDDERMPAVGARARFVAFATVVALVLLPLWRLDRSVPVEIAVAAGDTAAVRVTFADDPSLPERANWFQVSAFGEGYFQTGLHREGDTWVSDEPVPMSGDWRTVVRLHVGASMLLVPLHFPAGLSAPEGIETRSFVGDMPSETSEPILTLGGLPGPVPLVAGYLGVAALAAVECLALGRAGRVGRARLPAALQEAAVAPDDAGATTTSGPAATQPLVGARR